jgi:hypothetical protein
MKTFDFNPFDKRFNYKKGYQFYKNDKHRFLILRLEDFNRILSTALRKFLRVKKIEMVHKSNLETKKYIGEKYKQLKELKYPRDFLDRVYGLKYVNHFYTKEEIENFKNKWS